MTSPYWPIVATAVGGLLTIVSSVFTSVLTQRATLAREREAKRLEWERQRVEAERTNLRELQEALKNVVDEATTVAIANIALFLKPQAAQAKVPDQDIIAPFAEYGRSVSKAHVLLSWAQTEELRSAAFDVLVKAQAVSHVKTHAEIEQPRDDLTKSFIRAVNLIGKAGRELVASGPP